MPTVADLVAAKSRDTLFEEGLTVAQDEGLPTTAWQPGSVPRTLLKADATALADLYATQASIAKGAFLDDATGTWLTLLAASRFQVTRTAATFCEGYVQVSVAAGAGPYTIPAAGLLVSDGTRRWRSINTSSVTVSSAAATNIQVRAESPGDAYNVANSSITTVVSPANAGMSVNNPAYSAGTWITQSGNAEESDASVRARCRARWSTLGRGANLSAYVYWATTCPDATAVTRATAIPGAGDGTVAVYIAQASATASGGQVSAVQSYVSSQAPLTDNPTVYAAGTVTVDVTATVTFSSAMYNTAAARAAIEAAIGAAIRGQLGGDVDLGALYHAIYAAAPGVADVDISTPSADTAVGPTQIAAVGTLSITYAP